ncbi:hypothetical protein [Rhizorhabdus argentea]|uniref:hypothetical protein n=1 Tax=Rhizorhabdus argentea TaxID=1387174 RepID=UPI0030EB32CB
MADDAEPEKVGYCMPPKSGQIKVGEIRNPWGPRGKNGMKGKVGADSLPKTPKDLIYGALLEELLEPVRIKKPNGGTKEGPPRIQALMRKRLNNALSQETSAAELRLLFECMDKALDHKDKRNQEFVAVLKDLKLEGEEHLRRAKTNRTPIDIWPDPRNIVLDPFDEPRIDGPLNNEQNLTEYGVLRERDAAEKVLEAAFRACRDATSEEERQFHRKGLEHARARWIYCNERVGRRVRRPLYVLDAFELNHVTLRDGSVPARRALRSGKMDRSAFVVPLPVEDPDEAEKKRLEKMHYDQRRATEFDIWVCVERCREARFEEEKAHFREELEQLKARWRDHNAGVHEHDVAPSWLVHSWDPDKPVVEPEPPEEVPPLADSNKPDEQDDF